MFGKTLSVIGLTALMAVPASATTFDFTGGGNTRTTSLYFSEDGIGLTVTAGYFDGDNVNQYYVTPAVGHYSPGLGVDWDTDTGKWDSDEDPDHEVDGDNRNDLLIFTFDQEVELEEIQFSMWDAEWKWSHQSGWYLKEGNDEFTLFSSNPWDNLGTNYNPDSVNGNGVAVYAFNSGWVTDKFGVGASDSDDEFKIKSLTVSAITSGIPEPATWLMMIMGFGLVGIASRRRSVASMA
ncbi:PEPxxWA-CTERM sorting domain-containing protein [Pseudokordiimonas caeni]|uniref:PEPxxWA-CTERM sorting domain-containing protein n=1 Tax=Pseudokordiimonas caeni TaxID=2997908 RepID=UPI002811A49C|nr:PEPxxWA-CTERM sorting domain-containing protein [Pseudokordiimonas caeni]